MRLPSQTATLADGCIKLNLNDGAAYSYIRFKTLVYEDTGLKIPYLEKALQWKS
jgi:hypothetical protein